MGPVRSGGEADVSDLRERYAEAGPPAGSAHLDETVWERLACGELTPFERERAFDHIAGCPDCGQVYRGVLMLQREASAFDPDAPLVGRSGDEARSEWSIARWTLSQLRPLNAALAAALTACVVLGGWAGWLHNGNQRLATSLTQEQTETRRIQASLDQRQAASEKDHDQIAALKLTLDELRRPELNLPIVDLVPRSSVRSAGAIARTIDLPASAKMIAIVLGTSGPHPHPDYAVEIVDSRGQVTWSGNGLRKSQYGTFTLVLPRAALPENEVHLRVFGILEGRRDLVEEYTARFRFR